MKIQTSIEWNVHKIAKEFGRSRSQVSKLLTQYGQKPDKAGHFTTKQVAISLFGDLQSERIRECRARADLATARKNILEKTWVQIDQVEKTWAFIVTTVRQRLLAVPDAVAGRVHGGADNASLIKTMRTEINEALEELSKSDLPENFYENENETDANETEE